LGQDVHRPRERQVVCASAQQDQCQGNFVYIVSNGTNVWVNATASPGDLSDSETLTNTTGVFVISGYSDFEWVVDELRQNEPSYVRIRLASGAVCSRKESQQAQTRT